MKRIENGKLIPFTTEEKEGTRRQDYTPPAFMRNGAIYLTKREVVVNEKSLWGNDIQPLEMPDDRSINIDSHIDYLIAESMLREQSID
jgi:CMP-N-acetylneuraminic acid synthetase